MYQKNNNITLYNNFPTFMNIDTDINGDFSLEIENEPNSVQYLKA